MKNIILTLILITFITRLYSQHTTPEIPQEWIMKVIHYRDFLLKKDTADLSALKALLEKWDSLGTSLKEKEDFTYNVLKVRVMDGWSYKYIKKKALKYYPESIIAQTFTEEDLVAIEQNGTLLDMIFLGVLKMKYPFSIDPETQYFQELKKYNIRGGIKIGDIGAGTGMFSLMLKLLYPDVEIYINELDRDFVKYTIWKLNNQEAVFGKENIHIVRGSKKSTNLEMQSLDKIIIRNTFHHFSKKTEMLASLKKTLSENGELYLYESTKEMDKDNSICKDAMNKKTILEIMQLHGFELLEEHAFKESLLLKFKVNEDR